MSMVHTANVLSITAQELSSQGLTWIQGCDPAGTSSTAASFLQEGKSVLPVAQAARAPLAGVSCDGDLAEAQPWGAQNRSGAPICNWCQDCTRAPGGGSGPD